MATKKCLVYGDIMLDSYTSGNISRISPEAPVPVLEVIASEDKIGGAGNVANNLISYGMEVACIAVLGIDEDSIRLRKLLENQGVNTEWLISDPSIKTIRKERLICNNQQLVRMDYNDKYNITNDIWAQIENKLNDAISWADIVIISDYNKGLCEHDICRYIIEMARATNKVVIVDPKGTDWKKYEKATIITPNLKEINTFSGLNIPNNNEAIEIAYTRVYSDVGVNYVLLTRSEMGMTLIGKGSVLHIPATQRSVFDVSGAGDTVVATLAMMINSDLSNLHEAVRVSNIAAGIVVEKPGTAVVTLKELRERLCSEEKNVESKIYSYNDRDALKDMIKQWQAQGETIVTTNGCFDIIHRGHMQMLNEASKYGDRLIVAVNSDSSVSRLKGEGRPINKEMDRAYVLASMGCVDAVALFDPLLDNTLVTQEEFESLPERLREIASEAPMGIMKLIQADVHIKGGDYTQSDVPEAIYSRSFISIPFIDGYSSTNVIRRVYKRSSDTCKN